MIEIIRRILELQPLYSSKNTPEMKERGNLIRTELVRELQSISKSLSEPLGQFGSDFCIKGSDGMGRKTELPWVRFGSESMSPQPTKGFYCVLHFSTDGSAAHIALTCSSSKFQNGSFVKFPNAELNKRTLWARRVIEEEIGSLEPFIDPPIFGARRPLPKSFERAIVVSRRVPIDDLDTDQIQRLLVRAAELLRILYEAQINGRELSPADFDEIAVNEEINPLSQKGSQGIGLSSDDRKRVELRAMKLVEVWLKNSGYDVTDTSIDCPYDFEARKNDEVLIVEVKGTTSDNPNAILMTRNEIEVHRAEKGKTALFIVSSIRLVDQDGQRIAIKGNLEKFIGWDVDDWSLQPTTFRVSKP